MIEEWFRSTQTQTGGNIELLSESQKTVKPPKNAKKTALIDLSNSRVPLSSKENLSETIEASQEKSSSILNIQRLLQIEDQLEKIIRKTKSKNKETQTHSSDYLEESHFYTRLRVVEEVPELKSLEGGWSLSDRVHHRPNRPQSVWLTERLGIFRVYSMTIGKEQRRIKNGASSLVEFSPNGRLFFILAKENQEISVFLSRSLRQAYKWDRKKDYSWIYMASWANEKQIIVAANTCLELLELGCGCPVIRISPKIKEVEITSIRCFEVSKQKRGLICIGSTPERDIVFKSALLKEKEKVHWSLHDQIDWVSQIKLTNCSKYLLISQVFFHTKCLLVVQEKTGEILVNQNTGLLYHRLFFAPNSKQFLAMSPNQLSLHSIETNWGKAPETFDFISKNQLKNEKLDSLSIDWGLKCQKTAQIIIGDQFGNTFKVALE